MDVPLFVSIYRLELWLLDENKVATKHFQLIEFEISLKHKDLFC